MNTNDRIEATATVRLGAQPFRMRITLFIRGPQGSVFSIIQQAPQPARRRATSGEPTVEIPKPSEDDKQFFRSLIADDPEVEIKPMFGNLGAFVHGNMFAGLFGSAVGIRLAEPDASELAAIEGSGPFGPEGHAMAGYISLPATWREDAGLALSWVERARDHVGPLPPKVAKPRAAKPRAAKPKKG